MQDFDRRITAWKDTVNYCKMYSLIAPPSVKHSYVECEIPQHRHDNTVIDIKNQDSIEAGIELYDKNPLVLNFADDVFPGGHVAVGSGAQEESLFRRTNYHTTLHHDTRFYPLQGTDIVYSTGVSIIKDLDFKLLPSPFQKLSFVACPGLRHPALLKDDQLRPEDRELLKRRIETIFQVGYMYGHDALVLGALGCGAWNSPPKEVATVFKEVCDEWYGVFSHIRFAIFKVDTKDYVVKTRNTMKGIDNFDSFSEVFFGNKLAF